MRITRCLRAFALLCPLTVTACRTTLEWQALPRNVLLADTAAAFRVGGTGTSKALRLPADRSLFARPDAKQLILFRLVDDKLEPRPFGLEEGRITGDFRAGEQYVIHVGVSVSVKNKYSILCRLKSVHERLGVHGGIRDPLCTMILCPPDTMFGDALLDKFPALQGFPDEFPRETLGQMQLEPPGPGLGRGFPLPDGGFGGICEQCLGRDWGIVIIPFCEFPEAIPPCWAAKGPSPNTLGQVENITNREVVGAINVVAPHPTDGNIIFVGAVNGGIWRSTNAQAATPNWVRLTDSAESLSVGALEFDPSDTTNQTLVAGLGRFSSFLGRGGERTGLLRTTNNGTNWTALDGGGTLRGLNISGVAPRGTTIVISVNNADIAGNRGIWRSTDTGATWTQVSGATGTGLPAGRSFDLAGDPTNPARLFTNAGGSGVFRSTDTGATWTSVGSAALNGIVANAINIDFSVGVSNNVFVALVGGAGQLSGVFRSGDGGTTWTAMDLPTTANGGIHPGGQGGTHLSIAADRTNANIVYVGGDRQARPAGGFPNAIGANDFSGILFRGDASQPSGSQFRPITHNGTQSNSAPHADSRDMDMSANGVLIEGDDGGVYRRTSPLNNNGDWFSMNGNLQTTEFHAIGWDSNADILIGGAQDTGTPEQQTPPSATWRSVSTADGGDVAVDDISVAERSTRFSSNQNLGNFRRRVFDDQNVLQSTVFPNLTVLNPGAALQAQFYTPIKVNNVDGNRLIIGGANSVYESLDQGDTLTEVGPGLVVNDLGSDPIAYGATGNANMLYVGVGAQVFVRTGAAPAALNASAYNGGNVVDIAIHPNDPNTAFAVDATRVFRTTNGGGAWTDVTGNLAGLNPGAIRSLAFRSSGNGAAVVGTDTGVFFAPGPSFDQWNRLADCLPRVPVYDLEYDATDRLLIAGTLGRGAWVLVNQ